MSNFYFIESLLPSNLQSDSVKIHTELNSTTPNSSRYWELIESLAVVGLPSKVQPIEKPKDKEVKEMDDSNIHRGSGRKRGRPKSTH